MIRSLTEKIAEKAATTAPESFDFVGSGLLMMLFDHSANQWP
jgi:hypothetical protein